MRKVVTKTYEESAAEWNAANPDKKPIAAGQLRYWVNYGYITNTFGPSMHGNGCISYPDGMLSMPAPPKTEGE